MIQPTEKRVMPRSNAKVFVLLGTVCLLAILAQQAFRLWQGLRWATTRETLWLALEIEDYGLNILTLIAMLMFVRFIPVVATTMAGMFAFAGLVGFLRYGIDWQNSYVMGELFWSAAFALAFVFFLTGVLIHRRERSEQ